MFASVRFHIFSQLWDLSSYRLHQLSRHDSRRLVSHLKTYYQLSAQQRRLSLDIIVVVVVRLLFDPLHLHLFQNMPRSGAFAVFWRYASVDGLLQQSVRPTSHPTVTAVQAKQNWRKPIVDAQEMFRQRKRVLRTLPLLHLLRFLGIGQRAPRCWRPVYVLSLEWLCRLGAG
jgi:hypothetical protein